MSEFSVKVYRAKILPHPDPEVTRLELCRIEDYISIVEKGIVKDGDLVAYIPEGSVVTEKIKEELRLGGNLSGANHDRVKAIKIRKIVSQGLIYPAKPEWVEGQDVTEELGVTKYEPPIPPALAGEVYVLQGSERMVFDIENLKKYPNTIPENSMVEVTEKIHGTFLMVRCIPKAEAREVPGGGNYRGRIVVTSKGLLAKGQGLKHNERNENNTYIRIARQYNLYDFVERLSDELDTTVTLLGEIYGKGIQDLHYGTSEPKFAAFSLSSGPGEGTPYIYTYMKARLGKDIPTVPLLYVGLYTKEKVLELTSGRDSISNTHIREGVVVTHYPTYRDLNGELKEGITRLKSVSPEYLLRKNGTEFT